jgi:uncharacterized damage-inducible protein DinB
MLTAIRTMYAYSAWANARVLDTAAMVPRAQFVPDRGCGSVRDTLVHIAAAQWLWLQRWQGESPAGLWDPEEFADVESLRSRWAAVEADTARFVARLQGPDLERVVSYVNLQGQTWEYPLWQQLLHQANHATQHRSEAALQLTCLGYSPGWLDLLVYVDETAPAESVDG